MASANAQNTSKGRKQVVVEAHAIGQICTLLLDGVCTAEHAVNAGKVVGTRGNEISISLGRVILLQVSLLTECAHLSITLVMGPENDANSM